MVDDDLIDAVDAELEQVRQRRVDGAFGESGEKGALPIPELREIAERNFSEEWKDSHSGALTLLLKQAISRLDGVFGEGNGYTITMQEAAFGLYNIDGSPNFPDVKRQNLDHVDGHKFAYLARQVYMKAKLSNQSARTRKLAKLRRQLATIIVSGLYSYENGVDGNASGTSKTPHGEDSHGLPSNSLDTSELTQPLVSPSISMLDDTPTTVAPTGSNSVQSSVDLVFRGHPLVLILGGRVSQVPNSSQSANRYTQCLQKVRSLAQIGAIKSVVSTNKDLSLLLGDYLPTHYATEAPDAVKCYWNLGQDGDFAIQIERYFSFLASKFQLYPIVTTMGLDEREKEFLRYIRERLIRDGTTEGTIEIQGESAAATCIDFIDALYVSVGQDRIIYDCSRVDFARSFSLSDLLDGSPTAPSIVSSGCWVNDVVRTVNLIPGFGAPDTVVGLSGTGKTAFAYLRASKLAPERSFYIDVGNLDSTIDGQLQRLTEWLEHYFPRSVLILDNAHMAQDATSSFRRMLEKRPKNDVHVIFVSTTDRSTAEYVQSEDPKFNEIKIWDWTDQRNALISWARENAPEEFEEKNIRIASSTAINFWHFFYILRGSAESLGRELDNAAEKELSDIAWFTIAAHTVFKEQAGSFRNIYNFIDEYRLWPLTKSRDARGQWLFDSINYLIVGRSIVSSGDKLECRHNLEASLVIRLCCERGQRLIRETYADVAERLFIETIKPVEVSGMISRPPETLTHQDIKKFTSAHLERAFNRQSECERLFPWREKVQTHVDLVWRNFVHWIETWPAHQLYWLVTEANLSSRVFRYHPLNKIGQIRAVQSIGSRTDAADIMFAIQGLVGYSSFTSAQQRWQLVEGELRAREIAKQLNDVKASLESLRCSAREVGHSCDGGDGEQVPLVSAKDSEVRWSIKNIDSVGVSGAGTSEEFNIVQRQGIEWFLELAPSLPERERSVGVKLAAEDQGLAYCTAVWLRTNWSRYARSFENVSVDRLVTETVRYLMPDEIAAFIPHLWLASKELGMEMFDASPEEVKIELEAAIVRMRDFSGPAGHRGLFFAASDYFVVFLALAIGDRRPKFSTWINGNDSGPFGKLARSTRVIRAKLSFLS